MARIYMAAFASGQPRQASRGVGGSRREESADLKNSSSAQHRGQIGTSAGPVGNGFRHDQDLQRDLVYGWAIRNPGFRHFGGPADHGRRLSVAIRPGRITFRVQQGRRLIWNLRSCPSPWWKPKGRRIRRAVQGQAGQDQVMKSRHIDVSSSAAVFHVTSNSFSLPGL